MTNACSSILQAFFYGLKGNEPLIFYFTGTGNSQMVAETIADCNGDTVVSISAAMKAERYTYTIGMDEPVGFVMPTYYYGIPIQIPDFIARLEFDHTPRYVWTCLTCDGLTAGAGGMLAQVLRAKGLAPSARFSCPVLNNAVVMGHQMPVRNVEHLLDRAQKRSEHIAEYIRQRRTGNFDDCGGMGAGFITDQNYPLYQRGRKTKHFSVNAKCIGCGLCARECPAEAISILDGQAAWVKERCFYCLRCINRCPEKAIHFDGQDNTYTFMNNRVKGEH